MSCGTIDVNSQCRFVHIELLCAFEQVIDKLKLKKQAYDLSGMSKGEYIILE